MFKKMPPTKEKNPMFFGMLIFVGVVLGIMIAGLTILFNFTPPSTSLSSQGGISQFPPSDVSVPGLKDPLVEYIKKHGEDIQVGYANVCNDPETLPNQKTSYPNVWQNNAVSITDGIPSAELENFGCNCNQQNNRERLNCLRGCYDGLLRDFTVPEACALEGNTVTEALCLTKAQLQAISTELSAEQRENVTRVFNAICNFDGNDSGSAPDYACNAYVTLDAMCPGNNVCKSKEQGNACGVDDKAIGQNVNIDKKGLDKMIQDFKDTVEEMIDNSGIKIVLTPYETIEAIEEIIRGIIDGFIVPYVDPDPFEGDIFDGESTPTRLQCADDSDPEDDIFESGETYDPYGHLIFRDICVKYYGVTAVSQASCSSPGSRPTMSALDACPAGCQDGACLRPTYCVMDNECAQGQLCVNEICQDRRPVELDPPGNTCTTSADCPNGLACLKGEETLVGICGLE